MEGQQLPQGMACSGSSAPSQRVQGRSRGTDRSGACLGILLARTRCREGRLPGPGFSAGASDDLDRELVDPELLPRAPTLADLMAGIPITQIERYLRALRAAEQDTNTWWVLDPDGRRRTYRPVDDLKPETILSAFEGEPTRRAWVNTGRVLGRTLSSGCENEVIRRPPSGNGIWNGRPPGPCSQLSPMRTPNR